MWAGDWCFVVEVLVGRTTAEAVEPVCRGAIVSEVARHVAKDLVVPPKVVEDVRERVSHLPWRLEDLRVISVGENGAFASQGAVEPFCDANAQSLHTAAQSSSMLGLAHHVNVIALNREVTYAKVAAVLAEDQRVRDCLKRSLPAKVTQ